MGCAVEAVLLTFRLEENNMFRWLRRRKTIVVPTGSKNPPVKTFVNGNVETAVWINRRDGQLEAQLSFSRLEGKKRLRSFYVDDITDLNAGVEQANAWLHNGLKVKV